MNTNELRERVQALVDAELIVEDSPGRFSFRHALTHDAAYASLLVRDRKHYHALIGAALERDGASARGGLAGELSHHYFQAGVWDKALAYAQTAGAHAAALYAQREAVQDYSRALEAARALEPAPPALTLVRLLSARAQAYDTLGEFDAARADYEAAITTARAAHESAAESEALLALGFLWAGQDYQRAGELLRQATALAHTLPDTLLYAHSLNRLANWLANTGQVDEALALHRQALGIFEERQDKQGMATTHDLLGTALGFVGDLRQSFYHYEQAIPLLRALDDKRSLVSSLTLGSHSIYGYETVSEPEPEPEADERRLAEALAISRQLGWPDGEAFVGVIRGLALATWGHFDEALSVSYAALAIAQRTAHRQWMVGANHAIGSIYLLMLAPEQALDYLETSRRLAGALDSAWWTAMTATELSLAYIALPDLKRARSVLELTGPLPSPARLLHERRLAWAWARWSLAAAEPQVALRIAGELILSAPGAQSGWPIPALLLLRAEALMALGFTGDDGAERARAAEQALVDARRGAVRRRQPASQWPVHAALATLYRRLGRSAESEGEAAHVRSIIAALAATVGDPALRAAFVQRASSA